MQIPKLLKIVINMGVAALTKEKNALQDVVEELSQIAGQKAVLTRAKKSISNFKLREGQPIGAMVTLRGERMWDFADRFFNLASPRIRDFRGFNDKGDGRGNYTLGINDHQIFPELNLDKVKIPKGMNVTFVTSAGSDEECVALLHLLGLPFKNKQIVVNVD